MHQNCFLMYSVDQKFEKYKAEMYVQFVEFWKSLVENLSKNQQEGICASANKEKDHFEDSRRSF